MWSNHINYHLAMRTHQLVLSWIENELSGGRLTVGGRLPAERTLAEQLNVSRTSVREAIQGLVSLGVIERRGNRSFVVERLPDVNFHQVDDRKEFVRQLFETRRALELPIIELAAKRATAEQRADICVLADRFHDGMELGEFRDLDRAFHSAIARACGNPLLVEMYGKVLARLFRSEGIESLLSDSANRTEVGKIVSQSVRHHATIARAVAEGDAEIAVAEGTRHLGAVEQSMIGRLV
jgi:GntR family transcriptional repressor for pyruvate dehydrogenase complex